MKGTFPFSILKEDFEASGKDFQDSYKCPAATAFKRQFTNEVFKTMLISRVLTREQ